jgi:predicted RecA/RadA family phage recombinase
MALAQFIHDGKSIDYTPGADVAAGDVVVQNDLLGVAKLNIAANTLGALAVTGVFDVPKATGAGTAIAAGKKVYWDAADKQAKEDSEAGANPYLGKTIKAAVDADATVRVRLEQ